MPSSLEPRYWLSAVVNSSSTAFSSCSDAPLDTSSSLLSCDTFVMGLNL